MLPVEQVAANLGQFLLPLHGGLYWVALLGALLRIHPAPGAEQLLLLGAHLLDQVIGDVFQNGILRRRLQNIRESQNSSRDESGDGRCCCCSLLTSRFSPSSWNVLLHSSPFSSRA